MGEVTKQWVNEHGEGHWEVSNGLDTETCDEGELIATIICLRERSTSETDM